MATGILTGRHLPRRTFIRGAGAAVALPLLDAMIPAGRHGSRVAAAIDQTRLVCIEECHGLPGSNPWGDERHLFAPATLGRDFEMVEDNALKSLEPWQDYLTIVSNTDVQMAEPFTAAEIGGDHFRSSAVFLTQSHPKQTQGSDLFVGVSLDQMHAQRFGQDTGVAFAPALHRGLGSGRELLVQLFLRVHGLDQLGCARPAPSGDPGSPGGVRPGLRRGRHEPGTGHPSPYAGEHPGLDHGPNGRPAGAGWVPWIVSGSSDTWGTSAKWSVGFNRWNRTIRVARAEIFRRLRRVCRTHFRSTWS